MSKISIRFLIGFCAVTAAGVAMAQDTNGVPGSMSNRLTSALSSTGVVSGTRLNGGPAELPGFSAATSAAGTSNLFSALRASDSMPVATNVKLGEGSGKAAAPSGPNPFSAATASAAMSLSNALASAPSGTAEEVRAVAFVGAGMSNVANALSGQIDKVDHKLPQ